MNQLAEYLVKHGYWVLFVIRHLPAGMLARSGKSIAACRRSTCWYGQAESR